MILDDDLADLLSCTATANRYAEEIALRLDSRHAVMVRNTAALLARQVVSLVAHERHRVAVEARDRAVARVEAEEAQRRAVGRQTRLELARLTFGHCHDCAIRGDACERHGGPPANLVEVEARFP